MKAKTIIQKLMKIYPSELWDFKKLEDPFECLVWTILSQQTTSKNAEVAFEQLWKKFNNIQKLASANRTEVSKLIYTAGLSAQKSNYLIKSSREILKKYDGGLKAVLKKPETEARKELMVLPGVGLKTADVILCFAGGRDTIPVDTHVFIVSRRLGLASGKTVSKVKAELEAVIPPKLRRFGHLLLIQLGRDYCKARNPKCSICPVNKFCTYYQGI
ncbi:MAG: endonuclease III [Euryarchaeota archaeon]|nr:endonuclease III [Euryarchaeota archaeon]